MGEEHTQRMKRILLFVGVVIPLLLVLAVVATPSAQARTINDLNIIPTRVLQRSVSAKFFKSLLISPVKGWVVVRGELSGTKLAGLRVVRAEPNGLNNGLALQRAKDVELAGYYSIEKPNTKPSVLVHLLLYEIADGTMALSFAHLDEPGGNQMEYYGCARLAVLKSDGKWTEIKGPESLEGKGWAIRQGIRNDLKTSMKLERPMTGAESTNMSTGR